MRPYVATETGKPLCFLCSQEFHWLGKHVESDHGMTLDEYLDMFPEAEVVSRAVMDRIKPAPVRKAIPDDHVLTERFADVDFEVNLDVPPSACLPMPPGYRVPRYGALSRDIEALMIHLKMNRSCWVWGPPGTGKDAVFHAWSAITRTPALNLTVIQGADLQEWRYTRSFNHEGTFWEEGLLLKAVRDGYVTPGGRRVPRLILLSDFDRATKAQAEELRLVLDSIQGRILGPGGVVYQILPGTRIYITANTSGGGDQTGKHLSAMAFDSSLLSRVERKMQFHHLDVRDEEPILVAKFPDVHRAYPEAIGKVMEATKMIREAVQAGDVFCEWGHREAEHWVEAASDILAVKGRRYDLPNIMRYSFRTVHDGLANDDVRDQVSRLIDGTIPGGYVTTSSD